MYKSRLNKWGLKKNLTPMEVRAIVRCKVSRDAIGKIATEFVRLDGGNRIDYSTVEYYFRHNPHLMAWSKGGRSYTPLPPALKLRPTTRLFDF